MWETRDQSLGQEDPLEKEMATYSSTLAWKIPWMEEHGRLQSMGSRRVRHDWVTSLSLFTFMHWRRKWQLTPVFLPGDSQGREPGGLPSMGLHTVGHDWRDLAAVAATAQSYLTFCDPVDYPHQAPLSMEISQAILLECFIIGRTISVLSQSGFFFFFLQYRPLSFACFKFNNSICT